MRLLKSLIDKVLPLKEIFKSLMRLFNLISKFSFLTFAELIPACIVHS